MPLSAGDRLGPYEILAPLGAGGMGEVWKARDTRLDRIVAIKKLKAQHLGRFEKEGRAIAALNHPHICQIYDVGPDYLVLEYIEGHPLRGPLRPEQAVSVAIQIASALEAAHSRGILHRDLKPGNVLITASGAKLLDFGLAKMAVDAASDITKTIEGTVAGTAAYMSPEQAQGRTLDERSDLFSFGAVLHEMLSGKRAFAGDSLAEVLGAVLRDEPRPVEAPEALVRIVARCLQKSPAERFQNMAEVKTALEQCLVRQEDQQTSIAVLPFTNLTVDPENEYFSDGLAEEILNAEAVMAHVLFIDIVGSSGLATDLQPQMVTRLQQLVQATDEFQRAHSGGDLVSLPTGDGMALVFFRSPEQPAGCAVDIARALRKDPFCQVRMGIHSGPVFLLKDINRARNVSGAGINQAERVMSCGGGGQILMSDVAADPLRHLSRWKDRLHDAGMCKVKDGTLHVWNLYDAEIGSAAPAQRRVRFRGTSRALILAVTSMALAGIGVFGASHLRRPAAPTVATRSPPRSLSYSLLIRTKSGGVRPLAREMVFPPGYQLQFRFAGGQDGFLYVVNEGPPQHDGPVWTWLFPYPGLNQGSAALSASTPLLLPPDSFLQLDAMQGQEKVYLIWSDHDIPELNASVFRAEKSGRIRGRDLPAIRALLAEASSPMEVIKADTETIVRGSSPVLVKLITLEHL